MNNKQNSSNAFAEVIGSNLSSYTAQCWQWDQGPDFGSLVCIEQGGSIMWGIVSDMQTGSSDPQRTPFAYQKTEQELRADHPQIFEFLTTTFHVCVVGYQTGGQIHYTVPPQPAKIHGFVQPATLEQRTHFFSSPRFLPLLFARSSSEGPGVDELLLAVCQHIAASGLLTPSLFEQYYHTFSLLIGNDYRRLKLLLQRMSAAHAQKLTAPPAPRSA